LIICPSCIHHHWLGFDPIWFGVIITLNLEAGLITPRGTESLRRAGIAPDIPLAKVLQARSLVLLLLLGIVILCVFPQLATWLPAQMIG